MVYWQRNMSEWFDINLPYLFVHMLVCNIHLLFNMNGMNIKIHWITLVNFRWLQLTQIVNSLKMVYHHHHHHISVMELAHLLTRSGLTYPEVSSKFCHDSFFQLGNSVSLPWVIYYGAFYLHVVSSFSCIPVICLILALFLIPLQFVYLFCNLSECILLFFSCISSLLLLFFWHPLL